SLPLACLMRCQYSSSRMKKATDDSRLTPSPIKMSRARPSVSRPPLMRTADSRTMQVMTCQGRSHMGDSSRGGGDGPGYCGGSRAGSNGGAPGVARDSQAELIDSPSGGLLLPGGFPMRFRLFILTALTAGAVGLAGVFAQEEE